jgi:hypothetical protein
VSRVPNSERSALDLARRVNITKVFENLGGTLKHGRGQAFWRKGEGFNVALHDGKGVWFDHATNQGGGVLDLIVTARGGSRQDALVWLSAAFGLPLADQQRPRTREQCAAVRRQQRVERETLRLLPAAQRFRRAARLLGDESLAELKTSLSDTCSGRAADIRAIRDGTRFDARLAGLGSLTLAEEYGWWLEHEPELTRALVALADALAHAERQALESYLFITEAT